MDERAAVMTAAGEAAGPGNGPLSGISVVDLTAIGPGPYGAQLLGDLGADVIRVERAGDQGLPPRFVPHRNRRSIVVDLKSPRGHEVVMRLVERSDALLEGFRPGVMERLGLGPDECTEINPGLVYGRMTGWGQEGPMSQRAGHDINYLSLTGVLAGCAREGERPVPPMNLLGDFGGGGLLLAFGVVAALLRVRESGRGQVVDAAMVDGVSSMVSSMLGLRDAGMWSDRPGTNLVDTGAPFYDCYETSDGRYLAVGALEPKFYADLLDGLGLDSEQLPQQYDTQGWPQLRERLGSRIRERTMAEWTETFRDRDACATPVLSMAEALEDEHMRARETYVDPDGVWQPAPAPRFSDTPGGLHSPPPLAGEDTVALLAEIGYAAEEIDALHDLGAVSSSAPEQEGRR